MEIKEKFLPIGSVVSLNDGNKKIMITGFCSVSDDDTTKMYDYSGCFYPEGYLNSDKVCLFNHSQIKEVFYLGYESDEETEFKKVLDDILKKYESGEITISDDEDAEEIEEDEENSENVEELEYL